MRKKFSTGSETTTSVSSVDQVTLADVEDFCEYARSQGANGKERVTCFGGDSLRLTIHRGK